MECPVCRSQSHVLDSRPVGDGSGIRRRRQCSACSYRFTSYEYLEGAAFAAFAADLRAVIGRHERGAIPNAMRRRAVDADPIGEDPPAEVRPDPTPVKSLRERLKERRAAS